MNVSYRPHRHSHGFSLIELMVGIAVGLIGLLVVYKTLSIWDSHARTTTAGGDAQVAGTLAMFNLERDIKSAGMGVGMAASAVMGCTVTGADTATGRALTFPLYPVQIATSATAGAPDGINVLAGDSSFFVTAQTFTSSSATTKRLVRRDGFRNGDVAVVAGNAAATAGSADCMLVQTTDTSDADGVTIGHANGSFTLDPVYVAGSAASSVTSTFNGTAGTGSTFSNGTIYNLGPEPKLNRWQTDGRVLSRTEYLHGGPPLEISEGVINMKAQYGVDTDNDNIISASEWTRTLPADWTQVRAIRVAILVRSSQFEKALGTNATQVDVTTTNPSWTGGNFLMTNVDGTSDSFSSGQADPNNWRFYRYIVYEKVIPLRNMIWGTAPP